MGTSSRSSRPLARADFENGWDQYRKQPGIGTYTLAGLIAIMPRLGPLSMLAIRGPEPDAEARYVRSVNGSTASLRELLGDLRTPGDAPLAAGAGGVNPVVRLSLPALPNRDLDTGRLVVPGSYRLTDQTYAQLLARITHDPQAGVPFGIERDLLAYYAEPSAPISTRKDPAAWARVQRELVVLRGMATRREVD